MPNTSVDTKVVELKFDNSNFEKNVQSSITSLQKFDSEVQNTGKSVGPIQKLKDAFDNVTYSVSSSGQMIATLQGSFGVLSRFGVSELMKIENAAFNMAHGLSSALLGFEAASDGFNKYEMKMTSVQTIMSGTGESLETVNAALAELNEYSDKTIYSFSDMTQNIGKFTNAGVKLDDAVKAIQGVSNVAAISGADANEASRAMYNFAQALSKGYVQLIDWKSIENANMATQDFKNNLLATAESLDIVQKAERKDANGNQVYITSKGQEVSAIENFNDALKDGWMTTDVLLTTLGKYTDEQTELGQKAMAAAQDIKTFSQMLSVMKEAVSTQWTKSFEIIIGDFNEAKELWTSVGNAITGILGKISKARNTFLVNWKAYGGRTGLLQTLSNVYKAVVNLVKPLGTFWKALFPKASIRSGQAAGKLFKQLGKSSEALVKITEGIGDSISAVIKPVAKFIGELLSKIGPLISSGVQLVKSVIQPIGEFLGQAGQAAFGVILTVSEKISSIFSNISATIESISDKIQRITRVISHALKYISGVEGFNSDLFMRKVSEMSLDFIPWETQQKLLDILKKVKEFISTIKSSIPTVEEVKTAVTNAFDTVLNVIKNIASVGPRILLAPIALIFTGVEKLTELTGKFRSAIDTAKTGFLNFIEAAKNFGSKVLEGIKNFFGEDFNYKKLIDAITQIASALSLFNMGKGLKGIGDGLSSFGGSLDGLAGSMSKAAKAFGHEQNAAALKSMAEAILMIAGAIFILALIPVKKAAVAAGILLGVCFVLYKIMNALQKAVSAVSTTSGLMTAGVFIAIALTLVGLGIACMGLAAAILALVGGLVLLIKVIDMYKSIDPKSFEEGFARVKQVIEALGEFLNKSIKKGGFGTALAILGLAVGLLILKKAIDQFAAVADEEAFQKGIERIGAVIEYLGKFLSKAQTGEKFTARIMDTGIEFIGMGVAIILLAAALLLIQKVIERFADMSAGFERGFEAVTTLIKYIIAFIVISTVVTRKAKAQNIFAIAALCFSIGQAINIISQAVSTMGHLNEDQIKRGLGGIVIVMGMLALVMNQMKNMGKGSSLGLLMIGVLVAELTAALLILSLLPIERIIPAALALGGVMMALMAIVKAVGNMKVDGKAIAALVVVVFSLILIGVELSVLAGYDWNAVLSAGIAISAVLLAMAAMMKIMSGVKMDVKDIGKFILAIGMVSVVAFILYQLAKQDWKSMAAAGAAMALSLVAFAIAFAVVATMSNMRMDYKAIAAMSLVMVIMAASLATLAQFDWKQLLISAGIMVGAIALIGLALAGIAAISGNGTGVLMAGIGIAATILAIGAAVMLVGAGLYLGALAFERFQAASATLGTSLTNTAEGVKQATPSIGEALVAMIKTLAMSIVQTAKDIGNAFFNVILAGIEIIVVRAPELIDAGIRAIGSLIKGLVDRIRSIDWRAVGQTLKDLIVNLARGLLDAFKSFFGINSPSTVMEEQGGNIIQGLVNGLLAFPGLILKAIAGIGSFLLQGLGALFDFVIAAGKKLGEWIGDGLESAKDYIASKAEGVSQEALDMSMNGAEWVAGGQMAGQQWGNGTVSGMEKAKEEVVTAAADVATAAGQSYTDELEKQELNKKAAEAMDFGPEDMKQRNKNFNDKMHGVMADQMESMIGNLPYDSGMNIDELLGSGIEDYADIPQGEMTEMLGSMMNQTDGTYGDYTKIGEYVPKGFANGINLKTWVSDEAAKNMTKSAIKTSKNTLDENSPSRVFMQIGKFVDQGFARGISNRANVKEVTDSVKGMVGKVEAAASKANLNTISVGIDERPAMSDLKRAMVKIGKYVDSDLNTNPVIRPVFDMSDVNRNTRFINSLFGNSTVGLSGSGLAYQTQSNLLAAQNLQNGNSSTTNNRNVTMTNTFNISGDNTRGVRNELTTIMSDLKRQIQMG